MLSQRWKTEVMLSLLAAATCLVVACTGSNSGSGGGADTGVGTPDASAEDASVADAPDASWCLGQGALGIGPLNLTLDQEIAYLCSLGDAGLGAVGEIGRATKECGGLLAVAEHHGADGMFVYLFDPTTRDLVEALAGYNGNLGCVESATGIDLTTSPALGSCLGDLWTTVAWNGMGGGWAFEDICQPSLDAAPPEGPDSRSDAGSCSPLYGPTMTFDQEAASLSTNPQGVANWSVACGTMQCDGLLAIVDTHGADAQDLYLFDPTTGDLVEKLSGNNGSLFCTGSATGIDLTSSPAFSGCRPAPYAPYGTGGFDFAGCGDGGPAAADASSE